MAVPYVTVERGNPLNPAEPKKVYAQAKSSGELSFRNLAKEIAEGGTTVSDSDVMAVLNDLIKVLRRNLNAGRIVRFGDFGAFQVTFKSKGVESEEKFNASLIHSAKITFRPGEDLKKMLNNLKYKKIK